MCAAKKNPLTVKKKGTAIWQMPRETVDIIHQAKLPGDAGVCAWSITTMKAHNNPTKAIFSDGKFLQLLFELILLHTNQLQRRSCYQLSLPPARKDFKRLVKLSIHKPRSRQRQGCRYKKNKYRQNTNNRIRAAQQPPATCNNIEDYHIVCTIEPKRPHYKFRQICRKITVDMIIQEPYAKDKTQFNQHVHMGNSLKICNPKPPKKPYRQKQKRHPDWSFDFNKAAASRDPKPKAKVKPDRRAEPKREILEVIAGDEYFKEHDTNKEQHRAIASDNLVQRGEEKYEKQRPYKPHYAQRFWLGNRQCKSLI